MLQGQGGLTGIREMWSRSVSCTPARWLPAGFHASVGRKNNSVFCTRQRVLLDGNDFCPFFFEGGI